MTEPLSKIPEGFRYFSAIDASVRRSIEATIMSVFDGWNYEEIITPTVDYYSLFECGMGNLEAHSSFRFTDRDSRLLALRPDVTSGIARAAATLFANRPRPLRFCYAASVFRQQPRSHANSRRESKQIGCELLGRNSTTADMEVLVIAAEILRRLDLGERFVITINNVEIFNGFVEKLSVDAGARDELRRLVDIRATADLERFLAQYAKPSECAAFADLIQLAGKQEIFDKGRSVITDSRSQAALAELRRLWLIIDSLGMSDQFEIDLGDVARLDYYTGLTFTIYVKGVGTRVGGGGRYDNLTGKFGKAEPAIGFVLDLDVLADLLARRTDLKHQAKEAVVVGDKGDVAAIFSGAMVRRAAGYSVRIDVDEVKRA